MRRAIENQHRKYLDYDPNIWVGEFFDEDSGGYVVTHLKRRANADISGNETKKYIKELNMAIVFACNGYAIEMLNESSRATFPDVTIDGILADLKYAKNANNIIKYAKKAVRVQGARIVLFCFEEMSVEIGHKLRILNGLGIHGKYFVTGVNRIFNF